MRLSNEYVFDSCRNDYLFYTLFFFMYLILHTLLKILFNSIHYFTQEYYLIYSPMFFKFTNIIILNEYANLNFNPTHNFTFFN